MSRSWSSAHDWKSCKGQKLFESSNLSISAMSSRTVYSPRQFFNSLLSHPVAPPFQLKPAAPGFDLVFGASLNAAASVPLRCCIKILCLFSLASAQPAFFLFPTTSNPGDRKGRPLLSTSSRVQHMGRRGRRPVCRSKKYAFILNKVKDPVYLHSDFCSRDSSPLHCSE